jgi:hypothetical protein
MTARPFTAADLGAPESRRLLDWAVARGADELTLRVLSIEGTEAPLADAFEDALAPWARAAAERPLPLGVGGVVELHLVRLWALTPESVARLGDFLVDGLFSNRVDERGWFEDPTVYRRGALLIGVLTHDREGLLRVTDEEAQELASLGLRI